jgi:glycosyltransferase involved in cell wall biosynthesis
MPQVSVIVPARDAEQTLAHTLAALAAQEVEAEYDVIVVDDGSTDRTAAIAATAGANVTLVTQPASGPGAARDLGVARSSAPMLAFCDADVFPTSGWLRAGLRALAGADLVQGKVLPEPGVRLGAFDRTLWITSSAGLWEAANLFMTRELFDRVGGFGDGITPRRGKPLGEDVWLGYRALRSGARATYCPEALAHHAVFERDWRGYVVERARLRHFPALVRGAPELRQSFLYRRAFLNRRTARFDLALAGAGLALATRRRWPLLLALPYVRIARTRGPAAGVDVLADAVGLIALLAGSAESQTLLL